MTFRHDLNCEPKPLRITGILFGILEDFGRTGVTGGCSGDRASCRVGSVGEPRALRFLRLRKHQARVNTVFVHKLKQEGIEIALLVSHWLIFLTNQQTKVLAPNYNPKKRVVSHRSVLVI